MVDDDDDTDKPQLPEELLAAIREVVEKYEDALEQLTEGLPDGSALPVACVEQDGMMLVLAVKKAKAKNGAQK